MSYLLKQDAFFEKYRSVSPEQFEATGLVWEELEAIYDHYIALRPDLEAIGESMSNRLMKISKVHSVRFRVKDAEHLIEKIIRKRIDNADRVITIDNYLIEITDLVGLRAIHLFKEDWLSIHQAIHAGWELKEKVKAYVRNGDNEIYKAAFAEQDCDVQEHPRGYRSIHYITITKPGKIEYFAEIQVRTIFEEGWSEIHHKVSYPYDLGNPLYVEFLSILNRLAGSADEMGSFILLLKSELIRRDELMKEKQKEVAHLQEIVDKSQLEDSEKEEVKKGLQNVSSLDAFTLFTDYQKTLQNQLIQDAAISSKALNLIKAQLAFGDARKFAAIPLISTIMAQQPSTIGSIAASIAQGKKRQEGDAPDNKQYKSEE